MQNFRANILSTSVIALGIAALAVAAPASAGSGSQAGAQAETQTVPMQRIGETFVAMPVRIGDGDTMNWVVDTGASHSAIAQPAAEQFGFVSQMPHPEYDGPHNAELDDVQSLTSLFQAERFQLADVRIANRPPVELNAVVVPVTNDEPAVVAGLLGADAFSDSDYRIDFAAAEMEFGPLRVAHVDGVLSEELQIVFGAARVDRFRSPVRVMIDSGTPRTVINGYLGTRMRLREPGRYEVTGVDGRSSHSAITVPIRGIQFGGVCLYRTNVLMANLDIFTALDWVDEPAMVIGMDLLQHAEITVDQETGQVQISMGGDARDCRRDRVQWSTFDDRPS
ncbi:aspartyl protease family protein [Maricaulis sp.]|uniref:aspartyl protease family protein n=1 Tax=Maricaulis sp. TaxID=1486257 RepID=UPI00260CF2EA|nr:aspartyl protease family protein [Maricaulis sp.]